MKFLVLCLVAAVAYAGHHSLDPSQDAEHLKVEISVSILHFLKGEL